MDRFFGSVDFRSLFLPRHRCYTHPYSHNVLQGIKWKLWISSFYWYLVIWNWPSGLRAIASQSEAVFSRFQKCTHFATFEVVIFGNFFSKCCHMKTNTDKDMKPTAYGSKYPKFLLEEISSSLCQTPLKPRKFKVRTEVEVGSPIFLERNISIARVFLGLGRKRWPSWQETTLRA